MCYVPEHFGNIRKRFRLDDTDLDEARLAIVDLALVQIRLDEQRQFGRLDRPPRELHAMLLIAGALGDRRFIALIAG